MTFLPSSVSSPRGPRPTGSDHRLFDRARLVDQTWFYMQQSTSSAPPSNFRRCTAEPLCSRWGTSLVEN
eukprot:scaffold112238_cov28-Tisochrysis_lutea.AAC.2